MKSFLNSKKPIITVLLFSQTEEELLAEIKEGLSEGADAFGLQIERLPKELRTKEKLSEFISAMQDKPVYVTCYKRWSAYDQTDEENVKTLLLALECGGTMADIRGDLFDARDGELTLNKKAVKRQKELIAKIHAMGKEVLMSTHVIYDGNFTFVPKKRALKIAREQVRRGADMVKIITNADTESELMENFEIIHLLKREIPVPCIFLCNGKNCLRHRLGAGLVYEPIVFAKVKKLVTEGSPQQSIERYVQLFKDVY